MHVTFTCLFHLVDIRRISDLKNLILLLNINDKVLIVFTVKLALYSPHGVWKSSSVGSVSVWGCFIVTECSVEGKCRQKKPVKRRSERRRRTGRDWHLHSTSTPHQTTEQDSHTEHTHMELSLRSSPESGGVCRKQSGSPGEVSLTEGGKLRSQKN